MTKAERLAILGEITGSMGEALKRLERDGVVIDHRTVRLFVDAFCEVWKASPAHAEVGPRSAS